MKGARPLKRLALREYGPLIGWAAAWTIIVAAVGHADAVRLLAALAFVRAARYLTGPTSGPSLRRRLERTGKVHRPSRRTVILVETIAMTAGLAVVGGLIGVLLLADQQKTASLCLVLAAALPARVLVPLAAGRKIEDFHQAVVAGSGVVLAAIVWLIGGSLLGFAIALAARDWVALAASFAFAKPREPQEDEFEALHWREIAGQSHVTSRRRFTYRVSKSLLKFVFGPFGGLAARTGRGFRVDRKLERFVPRSRTSLSVLFFGLAGAAIALILLVPKPGILLVAASLLRVGSSAGNILIWAVLGGGEIAVADDDDDDDD